MTFLQPYKLNGSNHESIFWDIQLRKHCVMSVSETERGKMSSPIAIMKMGEKHVCTMMKILDDSRICISLLLTSVRKQNLQKRISYSPWDHVFERSHNTTMSSKRNCGAIWIRTNTWWAILLVCWSPWFAANFQERASWVGLKHSGWAWCRSVSPWLEELESCRKEGTIDLWARESYPASLSQQWIRIWWSVELRTTIRELGEQVISPQEALE